MRNPTDNWSVPLRLFSKLFGMISMITFHLQFAFRAQLKMKLNCNRKALGPNQVYGLSLIGFFLIYLSIINLVQQLGAKLELYYVLICV